jgi:uncharacterized protein YcbK (DUF882 family)
MPYKLRPDNIPLIYDALFFRFEMLRDEWNKPIIINSGFRCPDHNNEVFGEPLSVHLFGLALDLEMGTDKAVDDFSHLVDEVAPELRMGVYKKKGKFCHLDVGFLIQPQLVKEWRESARWTG